MNGDDLSFGHLKSNTFEDVKLRPQGVNLRNGGEEEFLRNCGTSCKLHFRVPLQGHQRWGGSHGKLSYNPHTRCCGGPCPDYPSVVLKSKLSGHYLEPSSGDPDLEATV